MQSIIKFSTGRWYFGSNNKCFYELLERNGHDLVFKVWKAGTGQSNSWKEHGVSTYFANESGAFEKIFLTDTTVMSDSWTGPGKKVSELPEEEQKIIMEAVRKDVEHRKKHKIPGSQSTYGVINPDGSVHNTER